MTRWQSAEQRRESALITLAALDVYDAVAGVSVQEQAPAAAREEVRHLTREQLERVAVALAVTAVWQMPPAPRTADEIRARLRLVRAWSSRLRLEATWAAS